METLIQPGLFDSTIRTAASLPRKGTQNYLVWECLDERVGRWVAMPRLAKAARCYAVHSRISDLRDLNWRIDHKNRWIGGQCHSFYRMHRARVEDFTRVVVDEVDG
jgi:hypothetical protein